MSDTNLIFDVGAHQGEDTDFYLKKGFRVVAIEANPTLAKQLETKFFNEIQGGRLIVVNKGVDKIAGTASFFVNTENTFWGTLDKNWADRNERKGFTNTRVEVETIPLSQLFRQFGVPYYVKIDIEGMDLIAVESISGIADRPNYVSIESNKVSFQALRQEFEVLVSLGYSKFKAVNQRYVPQQKPPRPAKEGTDIDHTFSDAASGLFGAELPGHWMSASEAIEVYRSIFLRYALTGDDPNVSNKWVRRVLRRIGFAAGWYDTHAMR